MPKENKLQFSLPLIRSISAILLVASAFYFAAPGAKASSATAAHFNSFAEFDTDLDGYIDSDGAGRLPDLQAAFDLVDRDGDGRLSPLEYAKAVSVVP